jgi:hypothetical protein
LLSWSWFLLGGVAFGDASLHRSAGSVDFSSLTWPGLGEHGEQDDRSAGGDVVGDAGLASPEVEAELSELAVQLTRERFSEMNALIGEKVDVALSLTELRRSGSRAKSLPQVRVPPIPKT